ncbi:pseudouridine synthase [uncultured Pseudokineococcus sp.]|uniref:pseudouridine synthase n=1 Tax=uncultured Pseudokineococcus sp. TaxID=1642928 RepID=UPI00261D0644|nr:pseudouridine synthase [uncultured Pseudokineococcus sp.]
MSDDGRGRGAGGRGGRPGGARGAGGGRPSSGGAGRSASGGGRGAPGDGGGTGRGASGGRGPASGGGRPGGGRDGGRPGASRDGAGRPDSRRDAGGRPGARRDEGGRPGASRDGAGRTGAPGRGAPARDGGRDGRGSGRGGDRRDERWGERDAAPRRTADRQRTPEEIAEERRRNHRGPGIGRGQQGTSGRGVAARGASSRGPAGTGRAARGGRDWAARSGGTRPAPGASADVHVADGVRLQKVLAQAGVGSRRTCEDLIAAGRVSIDGVVVSELGLRVDPERQAIHVDGLRVVLDDTKVYLALNKPLGVVSTMSDPEGRPCIGDLLEQREQRLFHVGRLDVDTEGLILVTNDGELANRLQHPSWEIPKTYMAQVPGPIPRELGRRLREGVELEDGPVKVDSFRLVDSQPGRALVELVLHEGRNHIVRRLLAEVGHPVEQLVRTRIGPVVLGDMLPGRSRPLARPELGRLMADVGL